MIEEERASSEIQKVDLGCFIKWWSARDWLLLRKIMSRILENPNWPQGMTIWHERISMPPLSQNIMNKIVHETAMYKALGSATKTAVCKKVDIRRVSTQRRPARDWRIVHMRATTGGKEAAKELHYSETSAYMYICTHIPLPRLYSPRSGWTLQKISGHIGLLKLPRDIYRCM